MEGLVCAINLTMDENFSICPYLGLVDDSTVQLSYPNANHQCTIVLHNDVFKPDIAYQERYCLTREHTQCTRFRAERHKTASKLSKSKKKTSKDTVSETTRWTPLRFALWSTVGLAAVLVIWQLMSLLAAPPAETPVSNTVTATALSAPPTEAAALATSEVTATATDTPAATPSPTLSVVEELPTPTVTGNNVFYNIIPDAPAVGWVSSSEARGNHLGDSFLHVGSVQNDIFHSVLQFNLERIPRGAPVLWVGVALTGLDDERLDRTSNETWQLRWLEAEVNKDWSRQTFQTIHNAKIEQTILPVVRQDEMAPFAINQFVFNEAQRSLLQQALIDNQRLVTFRLDGPEGGADNLFTWDSGFGPATAGNKPALWIVTGPAPATPPPIPTLDYIVVTSTPTPANVLTAAAELQTAVAIQQTIGTMTPTPQFFVTATPTPLNEMTADAQRRMLGLPIITTPTSGPLNGATALVIAQYATAVAMTTGTATPLPTDYITATPTPPLTIVTNTPTASSIQALLNRVIAEATRTAVAGPLPPLPLGVVTATPTATPIPTPANVQTAQARVIMQTIEAIMYGTWTPVAVPTSPAPPTATPAAQSNTPAAATGPSGTVTPAQTATPVIPTPVLTARDGAPLGTVIDGPANIRSGPGTTFAILSRVANNVQLSLTGRNADTTWLNVCCFDGQPGWIAEFLIETQTNTTNLPVVETPAPTGAIAPQHQDIALNAFVTAWQDRFDRWLARVKMVTG